MKVAVGADHRGLVIKEYLKKMIPEMEWLDVGADDANRSDYPLFAAQVCQYVLTGKAQLGVLLCGTGIGMAVAANRYRGIYAGLAWNEQVAVLARQHDNVNVLVLPSDFVAPHEAVAMVRAWHKATFLGDRYAERIAMIDTLTK